MIEQACSDMTRCIDQQAERQQHPASDHSEMMASVAHDLRTPLTALHGHLEALSGPTARPADARLLAAALAPNNTVCRLSQPRFELAALRSDHQMLHCERVSLDDLVAAAVQKFELGAQPRRHRRAGPGHCAAGGPAAWRHSLLPLAAPQGGTVLCLALPLAA